MTENGKRMTAKELSDALLNFKKSGNDWDKIPLGIKGDVKVVLMPKGKLSLTVNSGVKEFASKKDKYFRSVEQLGDFYEIFIEGIEPMIRTLKAIEKINGKSTKSSSVSTSEDALRV